MAEQATRTLRIFLSHTVSGQAWQREGLEGDAAKPNLETGENIPAWQLKIDGRVLEVRGAILGVCPSHLCFGVREDPEPESQRPRATAEVLYPHQTYDCGTRQGHHTLP